MGWFQKKEQRSGESVAEQCSSLGEGEKYDLMKLVDIIQLLNLTDLDLMNTMISLPNCLRNMTNLINLDLSSNGFTTLPDDIFGSLIHLQCLNLAKNELQQLPRSIGSCVSLAELRLDFNELKALPESIRELKFLEILTLRYNRISSLPATMGNLSSLRELDVSFNRIQSIPESLCFVVSLQKLNVASNFMGFTALPVLIGKLEDLVELDISNDKIKTLPDSFRFLSKLRIFRADETPLEEPLKQVADLGAKAVVDYMADYVAKRDMKAQQREKKTWFRDI